MEGRPGRRQVLDAAPALCDRWAQRGGGFHQTLSKRTWLPGSTEEVGSDSLRH